MTRPPWHNKNPLTAEEIEAIIAAQFPELSPVSARLLGEGWDNTTWHINQQWVFRFPKHGEASGLIQNELRLLPHLQYLPLAIPNPVYIGTPAKKFPHIFYGHGFLAGKTAESARLTHDERKQLAGSLGVFLKALHDFPLSQAVNIGIAYDRLQRINPELRFAKTHERLHYLVEHQVITDLNPWLDFFVQHRRLNMSVLWVVGHGDFYARHLVLNQEKKLTAVIDWGDAELLHPATDLAIVYQFLPKEAQDKFWASYGEVTENTKLLAKLRAIYSAATMAWYAHQIKDVLLMKESLQGLSFIAEIL